jgi:hypothetical protein
MGVDLRVGNVSVRITLLQLARMQVWLSQNIK